MLASTGPGAWVWSLVSFARIVPTEQDGHVLVDLNPNGQWAWLQEATGLPIAAAVAEELTSLREGAR